MRTSLSETSTRLSRRRRLELFLRIWIWFFRIRFELRRRSLPALIDRLARRPTTERRWANPHRLGAIVSRSLRLGVGSRRCLPSSLVLYRLLVEQGDRAQIVIGLPTGALRQDAHAWVEVDGADIGPSPAWRRHQELARYG